MLWKLEVQYRNRGVEDELLISRSGIEPLFLRRKVALISFFIKVLHGKMDCPELLSEIKFNPFLSKLREYSPFVYTTPRNVISAASQLNSMLNIVNKVCRKSNLLNQISGFNTSISYNFIIESVRLAGLDNCAVII